MQDFAASVAGEGPEVLREGYPAWEVDRPSGLPVDEVPFATHMDISGNRPIHPTALTAACKLTANIGLAVAHGALHRLLFGPQVPGWSWPLECAVAGLAAAIPRQDTAPLTVVRRAMDRNGALPLPPQVTATARAYGPVVLEEVGRPDCGDGAIVLYLHGGGYLFGSPASHRPLAAALVQAMGMRVLVPDYRLAPEHPYPAALEDVWATYWWLLERGVDPDQLVIAGESAGGGLVVALLLLLRDAGLPLPACAVCISPWVDLTLSAETLRTNAGTDYLNLPGMRAAVPRILDGADPMTPTVSPVFADLTGLPPLLIQAGMAEMLLDDARRLARRATRCGVATELELWENMVHAWHFFYPVEPAARSAILRIAHFVRRYISMEDLAWDAATTTHTVPGRRRLHQPIVRTYNHV